MSALRVEMTDATRGSEEKASLRCDVHPQLDVKYSCQTCSRLICAMCIPIAHSGHAIQHTTGEKYFSKDEIMKFVNYQEFTKIPSLKRSIRFVEDTIQENEQNFVVTKATITKQEKKLKYEISMMTRSFMSICQTLMLENDKLLQKYKEELEKHVKTVNGMIERCKDCLINGTRIDLDKDKISSAGKTGSTDVLHGNSALRLMKFQFCETPDVFLKQAFGNISVKGYDDNERTNEICAKSAMQMTVLPKVADEHETQANRASSHSELRMKNVVCRNKYSSSPDHLNIETNINGFYETLI